MKVEFYALLGLGVLYLILFAIAEWLYYTKDWQAEHTRKLVHVMTGLFAMLFPLAFDNHWYVLGLCSSFLIVLQVSKQYSILKSINNVNRKTHGSTLYPIIVYIGFLIALRQAAWLYYYLPLLVMAISDPIAGLLGKRFPLGPFTVFGQTKTMLGSLGFLITAVLVLITGCSMAGYHMSSNLLMTLGIIAIVATLAEAGATHGWDNFVIPCVIMISFYFVNIESYLYG